LADGPNDDRSPVPTGPEDRLDSWKDIAAHLKRDVTTVQRWEKREGMPVHRHLHGKLGSVYAFRSELDAWTRARSLRPPAAGPGEPAAEDRPGAALRGRRGLALAAVAALAAVVAGVASLLWLRRGSETEANPLASARFTHLTDFEGVEHSAVLSRDGSLVAFLSDRDGPTDVWVTHIGTGQFHNLTRGAFPELVNPSVRTLGFSPDAAQVFLWVRRAEAPAEGAISVWAAPTMGGAPRLFLEDVAELDWSHDGRRLAYHSPAAGDPLFVREGEEPARRIFVAPSGQHGHFPVWSPDDRFIYFVQGTPPDEMDVWRLAPGGGAPERLTFHGGRVSHPAFRDARTLMYLATADDGSGPWLHAMDLRRRAPRRLTFGVETYTSLAASGDGSRLVVTVSHPRDTLWRVPLGGAASPPATPQRIALPAIGGRSPRFSGSALLYVSARSGSDGIWKLVGGSATELWSAPGARLLGGPALSPDGRRIAFSAEERGRTRLLAMDEDGTDVEVLADSLALRGAPAWAPDGRSVVVAAAAEGKPQLMKVPVPAGPPTVLVAEYALDPAWSSDGALLAYTGPDVGTSFEVKAVTPEGRPRPLPRLALSRGARRLAFVPGRHALVVLRGEIAHKDLWLVDLSTGSERRLTKLDPAFVVRDFDVSPDGREIVIDRAQESSDIVLVELLLPAGSP
jgi:Tol biopolymer transport system component